MQPSPFCCQQTVVKLDEATKTKTRSSDDFCRNIPTYFHCSAVLCVLCIRYKLRYVVYHLNVRIALPLKIMFYRELGCGCISLESRTLSHESLKGRNLLLTICFQLKYLPNKLMDKHFFLFQPICDAESSTDLTVQKGMLLRGLMFFIARTIWL